MSVSCVWTRVEFDLQLLCQCGSTHTLANLSARFILAVPEMLRGDTVVTSLPSFCLRVATSSEFF